MGGSGGGCGGSGQVGSSSSGGRWEGSAHEWAGGSEAAAGRRKAAAWQEHGTHAGAPGQIPAEALGRVTGTQSPDQQEHRLNLAPLCGTSRAHMQFLGSQPKL